MFIDNRSDRIAHAHGLQKPGPSGYEELLSCHSVNFSVKKIVRGSA